MYCPKEYSLFKMAAFLIFKISVWLAGRNLNFCKEKEIACMVSVRELKTGILMCNT